jgi:hypothetical protein
MLATALHGFIRVNGHGSGLTKEEIEASGTRLENDQDSHFIIIKPQNPLRFYFFVVPLHHRLREETADGY